MFLPDCCVFVAWLLPLVTAEAAAHAQQGWSRQLEHVDALHSTHQ